MKVLSVVIGLLFLALGLFLCWYAGEDLTVRSLGHAYTVGMVIYVAGAAAVLTWLYPH